MNTAKLALLACPSLLAVLLLVPHPVRASETVVQSTDRASSAPTQPREIVFERPTSESAIANSQAEAADYDCGCSNEPATLDFSEQESKAAIDRYGCDCAGCLNAVRQLQGKLPLL